MIDFHSTDEQLINTFGEQVRINGQTVVAIFDEMPSDFDRSEDAQYKLTVYEPTAPSIKRDDDVIARGINFYVRSVQPINGVLEVILNR